MRGIALLLALPWVMAANAEPKAKCAVTEDMVAGPWQKAEAVYKRIK